MGVDSDMYVCGESLDGNSRVGLGERVVHRESKEVYTVAGLIYNSAHQKPVFLFENFKAHYPVEQYCRAVLKEQPKEESNVEEEQFEFLFENKDKVQFKDLSAEQMKLIVDAIYSVDHIVEVASTRCDKWYLKESPDWLGASSYRVKRKAACKTPLDIPWELIDKKYNYAAMDAPGQVVCLYSKEPYVTEGSDVWYMRADCSLVTLPKWFNIDTTGINWKRSLTKRPEGV